MSIVDPLTCGFAEIAVYSIFSNKLNLDVVDGENTMNTRQGYWKQNIINIQHICNRTTFNVEYRQLAPNFPEVTDKIKSLEKRYIDVKQEILQTFSKIVWSNLSFEDKCAHLLMNWDGCMKKTNYRKVLTKFSIRHKSCNKKLQKVVFIGTEWSLLADIANTLMKT